MITKNNGFDLNIKLRFPDGGKYAFTFIVLFVILIIIYANSFHGEWHYDDNPNIVHNTSVHTKDLSWQEIEKSFDFRRTLSRPIAYISFAINYYFGRLNTYGYHIVNFAIHYIASIFLFLFIYNTLKLPNLRNSYGTSSYSIALLAAFLWAINPLQVLAVSVVVQRMASMAAMFYIISLYLYLKIRTGGSLRLKIVFGILCLLSSLMAFGTKENATMLPVTAFLYDLILIQGITRKNLRKNIFIAIIPLALIFLFTLFYIDFKSVLDGYEIRPFSLSERLLTEPRIVLFYISLLLYPLSSRLTLLHDIDISKGLIIPWDTLPSILLILALIILAFSIARKWPFVSFSILFFFINHLIESSIFPLELIYEHRNYLPSMLFFVPISIVIILVLDYFSYRKSIQWVIAFVLILIMITQGHTVYLRNNILKSEFRLWYDNAEKYPRLSVVHTNLGKHYWRMGQYEKGFEESNRAIESDWYLNSQQRGLAYYNAGLYYQYEGNIAAASDLYKKSVELSPFNENGWAAMANLEVESGNIAGAHDYIRKAKEAGLNSPIIRAIQCKILLKNNQIDNAIRIAYSILIDEPADTMAKCILGEAFRLKGKYLRAIDYWERFLRRRPLSVMGHLALLELYYSSENKKMLSQIVGKILCLKKNQEFLDFIKAFAQNEEFITFYTPDSNVLLPIIRNTLQNDVAAINSDPIRQP